MRLDWDRVALAASQIPRPFVGTPQYRSEALSRLLDVNVFLKVESVSPAGTAASRMAEWWFESNPGLHRIVCADASDFGVAMAYAGRARGVAVELFGHLDADPAKVEELRHLGTTVRLDEGDTEAIRTEAIRYAEVVDGLFVEGGTQLEFLEGAATMAVEIAELATPPDAVFVPIGNGALAVAMGLVFHERLPRTRVVGVRPELGAPAPAEVLAEPLASVMDDTVAVSERNLVQAAAVLHTHEGLRVSLDGAAALAAAALAAPSMRGATLVAPVTGRLVG